MPGTVFVEKLLVRLFFSTIVLFLSVHMLAGLREPVREIGGPPATGAVKQWSSDSQVVTFFLRDYSLLPHLKVLVNGEERGAFESRYVTVAVSDGDVITIDGTFYSKPVTLEVLDVSHGLKKPGKGEVVKLEGNLTTVGRVAGRAD